LRRGEYSNTLPVLATHMCGIAGLANAASGFPEQPIAR
jgi:hypothetical protein